jgi:hypothetical protein
MPPSPLHEALRELFAKSPEIATPLLVERLHLPHPTLSPMDSEQTDPRMVQLLPDAVLGCPDGEEPDAIVIVEVQLSKSATKRRIWPQYVATAHARYGCPAELLVVTPDPKVERWAARRIWFGRRNAVVPIVLGPSALPLMSAEEIPDSVALAIISTLAHMHDDRHIEETAQQALWTLEALTTWSGGADGRLADILEASLPAAVRERMEELMQTDKYEYKSDFAKKYFAQGLEQGHREARVAALLLVLDSRGIALDATSKEQISAERDERRLGEWTRRAATATRIEDVLGEE